MNEDLLENVVKEPRFKYKEDVDEVKEELLRKRDRVIDETPILNVAIKKGQYYLAQLFEQDGTPKGDFRVSDHYKKKVYYALKHPNKDRVGATYYGDLSYPGMNINEQNEYLIRVTPTFLTDDELHRLAFAGSLDKKVGNTEIQLIPSLMDAHRGFSNRVEEYRNSVQEARGIIQKIDEVLAELDVLKTKLPRKTREVVIESSDDFGPQYK